MKLITLPNTSLEVSHLAYGTASYDGSFPKAEGMKLFAKYIEAGGNFIDTAHCYCFWVPGGEGASERFVGEAVREFGRENLVIATKGGHIGMNGYPRPDSFLEPSLVRRDLEVSLERLQLPNVDIYFLHRDDPRVPVGEIIEALNEHVASGQVRYLGASNWSVSRYREANAYARQYGLEPLVVLQNQWSLAHPGWTDITSPGAMRTIEDDELEPLATDQISVMAYGSTANGYFASGGERGKQFESPESRRRLTAVEELAKKHAVTPNQIALAYLINQPFPVIPVLGTRNLEHLEDALQSTTIRLSADEMLSLVS